MEMAGKNSNHYFWRCKANIMSTILIFLGKKWEKKQKCLELFDLARNLIRKKVPPPQKKGFFLRKKQKCLKLHDLVRKFPLTSMGGWAESLACADPGANKVTTSLLELLIAAKTQVVGSKYINSYSIRKMNHFTLCSVQWVSFKWVSLRKETNCFF